MDKTAAEIGGVHEGPNKVVRTGPTFVSRMCTLDGSSDPPEERFLSSRQGSLVSLSRPGSAP